MTEHRDTLIAIADECDAQGLHYLNPIRLLVSEALYSVNSEVEEAVTAAQEISE